MERKQLVGVTVNSPATLEASPGLWEKAQTLCSTSGWGSVTQKGEKELSRHHPHARSPRTKKTTKKKNKTSVTGGRGICP